jgi:hypothetical protein
VSFVASVWKTQATGLLCRRQAEPLADIALECSTGYSEVGRGIRELNRLGQVRVIVSARRSRPTGGAPARHVWSGTGY